MNEKTLWHQLFAKLLELLLTPVGIVVQTEFPVLIEPPRGDVLLLRRTGDHWTEEQRRYLPSGIHESDASHILIEFKATESLTADNVRRAASYDDFYRASQNLQKQEVLTVIISSRKPRTKTLEQFQFTATMHTGVYQCENILAQRIRLLSLNELDNTQKNALVMFFASQRKNRERALDTLRDMGFKTIPQPILTLLTDLWQRQQNREVDDMQKQLTYEQIRAEGQAFLDLVLAALPPDEFVKRFKPAEIIQMYGSTAMLRQFEPEEVLKQFEPEERLAGLEPEEVLQQFEPEERLAGLEPEVIEAYLRKLKAG